MTKSLVAFVQGLYVHILKDAVQELPELSAEFEKDQSRLLTFVEQRGLPFVTIDLPALGKHFDVCLDSGLFTKSCLAGSRPYKSSSTIPRLFRGLYLRVFNDQGELSSNPDVSSIRLLRQLFYAGKKLKLECENARTWKTVREFYGIERDLGSSSLNWDEDEIDISRLDHLHLGDYLVDNVDTATLFPERDQGDTGSRFQKLEMEWFLDSIQRVSDIISSSVLGVFNPLDWKAKHGPGAVSDTKNGSSKYDFPNWSDKLESVFPMAEFGFPNYGAWADTVSDPKALEGRFSSHEPASKLIAVPKEMKGPRLIASEPTSHQWCQQIIKDFLSRRVGRTWLSNSIHFRDQSHNQRAALRASTQGGWTIDLSSASDRLSCKIVERIFRRNETLLRALHASRTRWISQEIDRNSPRFHRLRKFSTMGSACTFPVQSIVFCCIALGVYLEVRKMPKTISSLRKACREVLVFGDDIIVPEDIGKPLQDVLGHLEFKVNRQKTFGTGRFRESCGCDAYNGEDVTPVRITHVPDKSRPESIISSVEMSNNFLFRGLWHTAAYIESMVHYAFPGNRIAYGSMDSEQFCFKLWGFRLGQYNRTRFNYDLQRTELQVTIPNGKVTRTADRLHSRLLQYFTEAPKPTTKWAGGVALRPKLNLRLRWVPIAEFNA